MNQSFIEGLLKNGDSLVYPVQSPSKSETAVYALYRKIKQFEENLDDDHKISARLANLGSTLVMDITQITELGPTLVSFEGTINGEPASLIQDVSQINLLLLSVPRTDFSKPKIPIGFRAPSDN